jgi:hypothetical protein
MNPLPPAAPAPILRNELEELFNIPAHAHVRGGPIDIGPMDRAVPAPVFRSELEELFNISAHAHVRTRPIDVGPP